VTGGTGAVGRYAVQLAKHGGATVHATASTPDKHRSARAAGADHVVDYRDPRAAGTIRDLTRPRGVDRVVDVAFGANLPLTTSVIATNGVIATYGSDAAPEPVPPFYELMRRGVTIRLVSVYSMPAPAMRCAISDITRHLVQGSLTHPVAARYSLERIVEAHGGCRSR